MIESVIKFASTDRELLSLKYLFILYRLIFYLFVQSFF